MVLLLTSDNEMFSVSEDVVKRSAYIKNMLEDVGESDQPIPLPNVQSNVMVKVLEYCEHHRGEPLPSDDVVDQAEPGERPLDIGEWDQKYIDVGQEMLFEIILAANYLDIKCLLDVGCKTVANMMKGKSPEEIRKLFNIANDFTPEEEAQIRKENGVFTHMALAGLGCGVSQLSQFLTMSASNASNTAASFDPYISSSSIMKIRTVLNDLRRNRPFGEEHRSRILASDLAFLSHNASLDDIGMPDGVFPPAFRAFHSGTPESDIRDLLKLKMRRALFDQARLSLV
ncbi:hypothetical protein D9611_006613 [Ephemerocybe angulata]|uniref:Uncharacterized protein n=1 Tax=Ephemerocybe angulata TaxID=980116 RepID=A0A8H5C7B6_9AGAR|nr:hypothetical protein D9611_006613 [Tulosesus angulatus]